MSEAESGRFVVSDAWREAYPGSAAGVLAMQDVTNPSRHEGLEARKGELERELRERFAGQTRADLRALPVIRAYDAYYRRYDKTYHVQLQLESVALKGKPLPSVAALVEAMFMAELRSLLLTAGHDLASVDGPIRLGVADGSERYVQLSGREQQLKAGDMFMADRQGVISSVLYGPDGRTSLRPETRAALFAVYAPAGIGTEAVARHLEDIRDSVLLFAPGARVESLEVHGG